MTDEEFIEDLKSRGLTRAQIWRVLMKLEWSAERCRAQMIRFTDEERALTLASGGIDQDVIALLIGKNQSTISRMLNPDSYAKRITYNREWIKRKRLSIKLASDIVDAFQEEKERHGEQLKEYLQELLD